MNKKNNKLFLTLALCLMAVFVLPSIKIEAAKPKASYSKETLVIYKGELDFFTTIPITVKMPEGVKGTDAKITKLKSSNKKVFTVTSRKYPNTIVIYATGKKKGTSNISFNLKIGSKKYSYKMQLKAVIAANPMKSFKIGNTNYASKFKQHSCADGTLASGILNISLKKNWKITRIKLRSTPEKGGTRINKTIKNKTSIDVTGQRRMDIYIDFINKKTGINQGVNLTLR